MDCWPSCWPTNNLPGIFSKLWKDSLWQAEHKIWYCGCWGNLLQSSVEFFDLDSNVWSTGPDLPFRFMFGALVQHPLGGVALIGGIRGNDPLDTVYYLPHAGPDATWQKLPQRLNVPRLFHFWFLMTLLLSALTLHHEEDMLKANSKGQGTMFN